MEDFLKAAKPRLLVLRAVLNPQFFNDKDDGDVEHFLDFGDIWDICHVGDVGHVGDVQPN